ncbi:MAG TPA: 50S ribosomal protein L15 [Saprospiraceae bacterium]|nr:50S ribosomal protein L15 [Saprospiraceae bacterium]
MELNTLKPAVGATKSSKRVGRGVGSGRGGTSTKGHKGAQSRSGFKNKRAFEGGQMPLQMRLPKRGFNNINRVDYTAINVSVLQELAEKHSITEFSIDVLRTLGIVAKNEEVKILANGDITSSISVKFSKISESAVDKIKAAGGSVSQL